MERLTIKLSLQFADPSGVTRGPLCLSAEFPSSAWSQRPQSNELPPESELEHEKATLQRTHEEERRCFEEERRCFEAKQLCFEEGLGRLKVLLAEADVRAEEQRLAVNLPLVGRYEKSPNRMLSSGGGDSGDAAQTGDAMEDTEAMTPKTAQTSVGPEPPAYTEEDAAAMDDRCDPAPEAPAAPNDGAAPRNLGETVRAVEDTEKFTEPQAPGHAALDGGITTAVSTPLPATMVGGPDPADSYWVVDVTGGGPAASRGPGTPPALHVTPNGAGRVPNPAPANQANGGHRPSRATKRRSPEPATAPKRPKPNGGGAPEKAVETQKAVGTTEALEIETAETSTDPEVPAHLATDERNTAAVSTSSPTATVGGLDSADPRCTVDVFGIPSGAEDEDVECWMIGYRLKAFRRIGDRWQVALESPEEAVRALELSGHTLAGSMITISLAEPTTPPPPPTPERRLPSVDDLMVLSTRQLLALMEEFNVSSDDCLEKTELQAKMKAFVTTSPASSAWGPQGSIPAPGL